MIKTLLKICCLLGLLHSAKIQAQDYVDLNKGAANQKNYYTTIPYRELKSKVIVQCSINGKPYNFIVDTGAAMSITPKVFKELHPNVITSVQVSDQAGMIDSLQIVSLKNIKLGDVTFSDVPSMVVKDAEIFDCFSVDGLIGSNLLRNSIIQFSSKTHTIILTDDAKKLSLKSKFASGMDLSPIQSNPFVWVEATNGEISGRDYVLFDSGMDSFYDMSMKAFQQSFAELNLFTVLAEAKGSFTLGMNGLPSAQDYYKVSAPQLKINGSTFTNVITETTYGDSSRIGADLFDHGLVTLDYKNRKFYFEPFAKTNFDLQIDDWPFTPTIKDNKLIVGIVWGERWREIIVPNDEIIQFDGRTYAGADVCKLLTGSHKSNSTMAKLVLKDAITGEIKEVEISKE